MPTIAEAAVSEDVITPEKQMSSARQSLPGKPAEVVQALESSPEQVDEIRTEAPKPIAQSSFIKDSVT